MKSTSYKIVPQYVPAVHIRNKRQDDLPLYKENNNTTISRSIDTECIPSEYISDGKTVIKLSELIKKLREHKEINLVPLSLSYSNNITEFHAAKENEAFSSVTIHVCVESKQDAMIPFYIEVISKSDEEIIFFQNSTKNLKSPGNILVQLYPDGKNRNVIEIKTGPFSVIDLKENSWYVLLKENKIKEVEKLNFYGKYNNKEYLIYELENDNFKINQKITVLNYL